MSIRERLTNQQPSPSNQMAQATRSAPKRSSGELVKFQQIKDKLHLSLIEKINSIADWQNISDNDQNAFIKQFIERCLEREFSATPLSISEKESIVQEIKQEIKGFGPLDPLLNDPNISEIMVNGPYQIYVEISGRLTLSNIKFKDNKHLQNIIERIVSKVGRRIDEKSPLVDARLPDGSRVNAVIPPIAIDGCSLSIRKFKADAATLQNLLTWGSMTVAMAETLKAAVKAHLNIVISGGTGSGKTTLLNSLSSQIPDGERIVTIEDSAELALQQEHVVRLETRPPSIEGTGAITARDLIKNSLRMRPDRVVIGECRGGEALDMLQAMNTGHDGSLTTLHANTPRDACGRIETMCQFSGVELPEKTIRTQIASAVHMIVQASRLSDGSRRVTYISEIIGMEGSIITIQDIFKWEQYGLDENGKVIGCHVATGVRPKFADKCKAKGIKVPLEIFDVNSPAVYLCKNPPNEKMKKSSSNAKPLGTSKIDEKESLNNILKQRKSTVKTTNNN